MSANPAAPEAPTPDAPAAPLSSGSSFEDLGDLLAHDAAGKAEAAQPILAGEEKNKEEKDMGAAAAPTLVSADDKLPLPDDTAAGAPASAGSTVTSETLFYWQDATVSFAVLAFGSGMFIGVCFKGYSLLSMAALMVILNLLVSGAFAILTHEKSPVRSALARWRQVPTVVSLVALAAKSPVAAEAVAALRSVLVERVGPMIEGGVRCKSVLGFLRTGAVAFIVYVVGCWFSFASLAFLAFLAAFTVPVTYRKFHVEIDAQVEKLSTLVTGKWQEVVKSSPQLQKVMAFLTAGEEAEDQAGKPKKA